METVVLLIILLIGAIGGLTMILEGEDESD